MPPASNTVRDSRIVAAVVAVFAVLTFGFGLFVIAWIFMHRGRSGPADPVSEEYSNPRVRQLIFVRLPGTRGQKFDLGLSETKTLASTMGFASPLAVASKDDIEEFMEVTGGQIDIPGKFLCELSPDAKEISLVGTPANTTTFVHTPIQKVIYYSTLGSDDLTNFKDVEGSDGNVIINAKKIVYTASDGNSPEDTPYVALMNEKPNKNPAALSHRMLPINYQWWSISDVAEAAEKLESREAQAAKAAAKQAQKDAAAKAKVKAETDALTKGLTNAYKSYEEKIAKMAADAAAKQAARNS